MQQTDMMKDRQPLKPVRTGQGAGRDLCSDVALQHVEQMQHGDCRKVGMRRLKMHLQSYACIISDVEMDISF